MAVFQKRLVAMDHRIIGKIYPNVDNARAGSDMCQRCTVVSINYPTLNIGDGYRDCTVSNPCPQVACNLHVAYGRRLFLRDACLRRLTVLHLAMSLLGPRGEMSTVN